MSPSQRRPHVVLDREYEGTTATLRAARTDVVGCLNARGIDPELQERAELVLSELASNAVQAAPGKVFSLRLAMAEDGALVLAVTSHTLNGGPPPREDWGPTTLLAPSGRGLIIVDELSDNLDIDRPAKGTIVVTATLR